MKVYCVYYYDNYENFNLLTICSNEDKAREFIESCKKPFYRENNIVRYDYSDLDLNWDVWEVDEFNNIIAN